MKNVLSVLFLFLSFAGFGQLTFAENIISDNSKQPEGVTDIQVADLDGDGDQDLITASEDDNKIAWYENLDGNGTFVSQNIISTDVSKAQHVDAADMDGDGDVDLVAIGLDYIVYAYKNDGNGNFIEEKLTPNILESMFAANVKLADIDMDGKVDIVVSSDLSEGLTFYRNIDNLGNYEKIFIAEVGIDFEELEIGDIDDDGDLDIVAHKPSPGIGLAWYEYSVGTFIEHEIDVHGIFNDIKLADLDNDGDLDLVLGSDVTFDHSIIWIEFTWEFTIEHILEDFGVPFYGLDVADVNQDGHLNIIAGLSEFDGIVWMENVASSSPVTINIIPNSNNYLSALLVSDINGDAYPDIIVDPLIWYFNQPTSNDFSNSNRLPTITNGAYDVGTLDVDGDGDLDIISASTYDGRIGWFENMNGLGNYDLSQNLITDEVRGVTDIHLADMDEDGDKDIVGSSYFQNAIFWIRNDGNTNFSEVMIIDSMAMGANSVDVGDVDGDGDLDIIATNHQGERINLYENMDGENTFSAAISVLNNVSYPNIVKLADVDLDQDLDVIYNVSGGGILWLENMGDGSFMTPIMIASDDTGLGLTTLEVVDIDGDGDVDILASGSSFQIDTYIYINEEGSFGDEIKLSNFSSSALLGADVDQDGDMDIIAGDLFSYSVVIYEQLEDLTFTMYNVSTTNIDYAYNLAVADIDNDGDIDILSASISDDKIAWYKNYDPVSIDNVDPVTFSISPLPATDVLTIHSEVPLRRVIIYNMQGELQMWTQDIANVDVSDLATGLYIIQVIDAKERTSAKKFVKM